MSYDDDTRVCIRGCLRARNHVTDCPDREHCRGCLPRSADYGDLCWPCHRRLELMLADFPTVADWLNVHLPRGSSRRPKADYQKPKKAEAAPIPIDLDVLDVGETIYASIRGWVDALVDSTSLTGPADDHLQVLCAYLRTHLTAVECAPFIAPMWDELAWLTSDAHALAPWRPEVRRLDGIPCPECHIAALVIFGGDTDATCTECRHIIPESIYPLWTKVAAEKWGKAS
jgi:hypothetical protein